MLNFSPTVPQYQYITCSAKYPALIAGMGSGKTEVAVYRSIIGKLAYPEVNRGFYEPNYDLVRVIAFPRFEEVLEQAKIPYKLTKTPVNRLDIEGYKSIYFRTMENPSKIIGFEHGDADVDELDTLRIEDANEAWRRIISRNRQKKHDGSLNTIGVTTTPEGFNFVYQKWAKGDDKMLEQRRQDGYVIIKASTYSNKHLPPEYIDNMREIYPESLLSAYLMGEFVNLFSGTVYRGYNREKNRSHESVQKNDHLYIGMDFNVDNMSAVVYVKRTDIWHAVDEFKKILDTPSIIDAIKRKYPNDVTIYPDASGGYRKSQNAAISDIHLLKQAGFRVKAHQRNPMVKDRINATNAAFDHNRVMINDEKCPEYALCLEQLPYDDHGEPDKKSGLDHMCDAGTYPIEYEMPIRRPVAAVDVRFMR